MLIIFNRNVIRFRPRPEFFHFTHFLMQIEKKPRWLVVCVIQPFILSQELFSSLININSTANFFKTVLNIFLKKTNNF